MAKNFASSEFPTHSKRAPVCLHSYVWLSLDIHLLYSAHGLVNKLKNSHVHMFKSYMHLHYVTIDKKHVFIHSGRCVILSQCKRPLQWHGDRVGGKNEHFCQLYMHLNDPQQTHGGYYPLTSHRLGSNMVIMLFCCVAGCLPNKIRWHIVCLHQSWT